MGKITLDVTIDSRRWKRVRDLRRYGPTDQVYTLRKAPDGKSVLEFGDGKRGMRLPKGGTIRVTYRTGKGTAISLEQSPLPRVENIVIWLVTHRKTAAIGIDHYRGKKVTGDFFRAGAGKLKAVRREPKAKRGQ